MKIKREDELCRAVSTVPGTHGCSITVTCFSQTWCSLRALSVLTLQCPPAVLESINASLIPAASSTVSAHPNVDVNII